MTYVGVNIMPHHGIYDFSIFFKKKIRGKYGSGRNPDYVFKNLFDHYCVFIAWSLQDVVKVIWMPLMCSSIRYHGWVSFQFNLSSEFPGIEMLVLGITTTSL